MEETVEEAIPDQENAEAPEAADSTTNEEREADAPDLSGEEAEAGEVDSWLEAELANDFTSRFSPGASTRLHLSGKARFSSNGSRSTFVINTGAVDRHGTIIVPAGLDFSRFQQNPVVLYNHDHSKVVARCVSIELKEKKVIATVEWDMDDPFAASVARKVKQGFLSGASIGFRVMKRPQFVEVGDKTVLRFEETELLEFSIVTVPSNHEALALMRGAVPDVAARLDELTEAVRSLQESMLGVIEVTRQMGTAQPAPEETPEGGTAAAGALEVPEKKAKFDYRKFARDLRQTIKDVVSEEIDRAEGRI